MLDKLQILLSQKIEDQTVKEEWSLKSQNNQSHRIDIRIASNLQNKFYKPFTIS